MDWLSALGNVHDSIQTIERNIRDHAAAISRHDNLITEVTQAVQQTQTAFATQASENVSHHTRWTSDMTQHMRTNFATVDVVEQLRLYSVSLEARINSLMQFVQSTGRNEAEAAMNQEAAPPCEAQDVTAPIGGTLFNSFSPLRQNADGPPAQRPSGQTPAPAPCLLTPDATTLNVAHSPNGIHDPFQDPANDAWHNAAPRGSCPCPSAVPMPEMYNRYDREPRPYARAFSRGPAAAPSSWVGQQGHVAPPQAHWQQNAHHPMFNAPCPAPAAGMPTPGQYYQTMGNTKAIHSKSESLRKWNGQVETFTAWARHLTDHMGKVHPFWKRTLNWLASTQDRLDFAALQGLTLGPCNEDALDLTVKLEQLIADYLPEKQYLRRAQLAGGKTEEGNGFAVWRRLHRDNQGEGQIVDYAGTQCLREYGQCSKLEDVSVHIDGWYELFEMYGRELESAHMMTRGMFLDIIPKELKTEILREPTLQNAGHRALAQWCRNRVLVLTSEKMAEVKRKELTARSKIGSLHEAVPTGEGGQPSNPAEAPPWFAQFATQMAALRTPAPKAGRKSSPRRSPSPGRRQNLIDWPPGRCFHCGSDNHTRDKCEKFAKMMAEANKGITNKKDWKPPEGYKSAIAKAREAARASGAKPKAKSAPKKVTALLQDSVAPAEDTASDFSSDEDGDLCALRRLPRSKASIIAKVTPQPTHVMNSFDGLEEGQSYDLEMLQSFNNWAHKVRVKPQAHKKAKAVADPEIERQARYIAGKARPSSSPIVIVQNSHDVDRSVDIIKPLPSCRKAMTKLVHKVTSNITCAADEKLCMVDSGAFTHAIDAETELPDHELIAIGANERSPDGESACGGIMRCLGRVKTKGTVEGMSLDIAWQSMKVKVPILSVRKLVRDKHHVRFHSGGGYIKNLQTGQRIPFFEYQGVYYLKMKILPPIDQSSSPVFSRPEP